jgi:hypothetical protein
MATAAVESRGGRRQEGAEEATVVGEGEGADGWREQTNKGGRGG